MREQENTIDAQRIEQSPQSPRDIKKKKKTGCHACPPAQATRFRDIFYVGVALGAVSASEESSVHDAWLVDRL